MFLNLEKSFFRSLLQVFYMMSRQCGTDIVLHTVVRTRYAVNFSSSTTASRNFSSLIYILKNTFLPCERFGASMPDSKYNERDR